MGKIVQIKIGEARTFAFFDLNDVACIKESVVVMELPRGAEYGEVVSDVSKVCDPKGASVEGKILRVATPGDLTQIENNKAKAKDSLNICVRKITDRHLPMQIVKSEYSFDSSKLIFFFTAEGRVDFRELVQDLAKVFRVRIELKQIGVRDKAKIIGGISVCGRELCCSSFLKGFHSLSVKMAKDQNLPLNPSRISGMCGRIKCCMAYEYQVYRDYAKELPKPGQKINTPEGRGKVIEVNVLKRFVQVDLGEGKTTKVVFSSTPYRESPSPGFTKANDN